MYSTIEGLFDSFGKTHIINLVNDEGAYENEIDINNSKDERVKRLSKAIDKAANEINGYLENLYDIPFSSTPARLIPISDDITHYYLTQRRNSNNMPEDIVSAYRLRIKDLDKIASGTINLNITEQPTDMSSEAQINKTSTDQMFSKDVWDKY